MKYGILFIVLALLLSTSSVNAQREGSKQVSDPVIYSKVDSLIQIMTLEEKAGQMLNLGLASILTGPFYSYRDTLVFDSAKVQELLVKYGAGSVQNLGNFPLTPKQWRQVIGFIQKTSKERTRLGIPVLYGIDAVHGATYTAGSVMFPQQINLAATFNQENAKKVGEITAYEMKASGIPWNYAPVLDVARHPLWGRIFESFGEDTYLTTQMGLGALEGMQGTNPATDTKVLACAKHFIGYGASYNGKDRSPVNLSENYIRQVLLPPFKQAVENGLLAVMVSSGVLNGTPSHIDHFLLTDLLKKELGFKGVIITDWSDIDNLHSVHKVAADEREAVKLSVLAGVDICMEPYDASFVVNLVDLVKSGEVPVSRVDDAVRRILYFKYKSGVFDNLLFDHDDYTEFASKKSDSINHQIACESLTLLKNQGNVLPLKKGAKVLVTGVASNSINYLNGGWSRTWSGQDTSYNDKNKLTILGAIQQKVGKNNVLFAPGTGYTDGDYVADAVQQAKNVDAIIICVGEKPSTEKPSDIDELDLPEIQQKLVTKLAETGKPIILVMVQGRPRIIRKIEPSSQGIIMAFLPGNEGGRAISDVLYGDFNPSGKLPYTYPRYSGSLWTYDHLLCDERDVNFGLDGFTPQYEVGFGLSYTTFEYSNLTISKDSISKSDTLRISIDVKNTGELSGKEAVLLFVSDEVASISPPVKQLKQFKKIAVEPGKTEKVEFKLTSNELQFVNRNNQWVTEPGFFTISIGNQKTRFKLVN
ncbi:MAG: glycoside hydrolase family 3 N-terminal domain-containing protein [Salinivirgaceae bacterium]